MTPIDILLIVGSLVSGLAIMYWMISRTKPDFTTRHGIAVWTNGYPVTAAMVERETEEAAELYAAGFPRVFSGIRLYMKTNPFYDRYNDMIVAGTYTPSSRIIKLAYTPDLEGGALVHELRHDTGWRHDTV